MAWVSPGVPRCTMFLQGYILWCRCYNAVVVLHSCYCEGENTKFGYSSADFVINILHNSVSYQKVYIWHHWSYRSERVYKGEWQLCCLMWWIPLLMQMVVHCVYHMPKNFVCVTVLPCLHILYSYMHKNDQWIFPCLHINIFCFSVRTIKQWDTPNQTKKSLAKIG